MLVFCLYERDSSWRFSVFHVLEHRFGIGVSFVEKWGVSNARINPHGTKWLFGLEEPRSLLLLEWPTEEHILERDLFGSLTATTTIYAQSSGGPPTNIWNPTAFAWYVADGLFLFVLLPFQLFYFRLHSSYIPVLTHYFGRVQAGKCRIDFVFDLSDRLDLLYLLESSYGWALHQLKVLLQGCILHFQLCRSGLIILPLWLHLTYLLLTFLSLCLHLGILTMTFLR